MVCLVNSNGLWVHGAPYETSYTTHEIRSKARGWRTENNWVYPVALATQTDCRRVMQNGEIHFSIPDQGQTLPTPNTSWYSHYTDMLAKD